MIRFLSSFAFLLLATLIVSAADDKPATPTLPQALGTNVVGKHTFSPAWTGQCSVGHATGIFRQTEPPVVATNRYRVKFDTVVIPPKAQIGNVGARGLRIILEELMLDLMYQLPQQRDQRELTITKEMVLNKEIQFPFEKAG